MTASGLWQAQRHSSGSGAWIGWLMVGPRLTTRGSAAGGMPARSEFYGPLPATGGQHRVEPGARRARQLQPLVRQHRQQN